MLACSLYYALFLSMYHPFALGHPLCNSDILSSLLASQVINDIKKSPAHMILSSNISLSLQHVANDSPLFLNAQHLTLSEPPPACIFCSEFFISQRGTALFLSLHYFWYYIHVHVLECCSLAYPTIRNLSHPFSDLTHISLYSFVHSLLTAQ